MAPIPISPSTCRPRNVTVLGIAGSWPVLRSLDSALGLAWGDVCKFLTSFCAINGRVAEVHPAAPCAKSPERQGFIGGRVFLDKSRVVAPSNIELVVEAGGFPAFFEQGRGLTFNRDWKL